MTFELFDIDTDEIIASDVDLIAPNGYTLGAPVTDIMMRENGYSEIQINQTIAATEKLRQHRKVKYSIDKELAAQQINPREQIVTTANGLQFALIGLSTLVEACSKSSDPVLKEASKPLQPFADSFLKARKEGNMPVDILGMESVAQKVINTSVISGEVVKEVLSEAQI